MKTLLSLFLLLSSVEMSVAQENLEDKFKDSLLESIFGSGYQIVAIPNAPMGIVVPKNRLFPDSEVMGSCNIIMKDISEKDRILKSPNEVNPEGRSFNLVRVNSSNPYWSTQIGVSDFKPSSTPDKKAQETISELSVGHFDKPEISYSFLKENCPLLDFKIIPRDDLEEASGSLIRKSSEQM